MSRLTSEVEVPCPCCGAVLVFDRNLGRIISHAQPERGDKPELNDAQRIVAAEAARREAIFEKSVQSEKTRGDDLSRRFEEALRQAKQEPISRPKTGFRSGLSSVHNREGREAHAVCVELRALTRLRAFATVERRIPSAFLKPSGIGVHFSRPL